MSGAMGCPKECDVRWRRLIDAVILGELAAPQWERLRGHLRGCDPCRERYNRAVLAERMLHGGPAALAAPSPPELERIGASLFAAADARRPAWQRARAWLASPRHLGAVVAAAAAIALVPLVARAPSPAPSPSSDFQARGGAPTLERAAGLRAFCLEGERVTALDPKSGVPACDRSSNLKLTVSNHGEWTRVFLVGIDDAHALKWYAPRPPESESVEAPAGPDAIDAPVGAAVRLAVNHAPGPVRIFALFSDKPVHAAEVEAAAAALERRGARAADAETLPLGRADVLQRSLLIEVRP
jgi:hypothetical protein